MLKTVLTMQSRYLPKFLWFLLLYTLVILGLSGTGEEKFEHLHLILDISNAILSLLLMLFLLGEQYQIQPNIREYLAIGFSFAAATELLHALIGIEWSGWFAWIQIYSGTLRPATWPPSTYVLPLALAWTFWLTRHKTAVKPVLFASGIALLTVGLFALSLMLPRYTDTGILGIQRPTQVPLLLLWVGVIAIYWRERRTHPLYEGLALMGVLLFLSDLCMLYSTSPHEKFTMMAHAGKMIAYALLHVIQMHIAAEDSRGRSAAESALFLEKERLHATIETSMDAVIKMNSEGVIIGWSGQAENIFGWKRQEAVGRMLHETIIPPQYREAHINGLKRFLASGEKVFLNSRVEIFGLHRDGHEFPVEIAIASIMIAGKYEFSGFIHNITARKQAEDALRLSEQRFRDVSDAAGEYLWEIDANMVYTYVSNRSVDVKGYGPEELLGHTPMEFMPEEDIAPVGEIVNHAIANKAPFKLQHRDITKSGAVLWEEVNGMPFYDENGKVIGLRGAGLNITERKQAEAEIENLAFYDPLTHLPNRRLLMDRLKQALASSTRNDREGALLFLDLDNFKAINDTLGHDVGDLLLQQVAERLESCVREGDTVARLGGDEFVVMLEDLSEHALEAAAQAEAVGEKILAALNQPYQLAAQNHHSTSSIGVTLFSDHEQSQDELLKQADIAMYQAKKGGRNTLRFFDPQMQDTITTRVALESDLRRAVAEQEEFQLYYQIQVDSLGRSVGAESLLRWQHPERGLVSPLEFIPLAEETGLILPLGHWVMSTACRQLAAWATQPETTHLTLAVNVSAKQFHMPTFVEEVLTLIDYFKIDPAKLKLEITESMLLGNVNDIIIKMAALKVRGINFSMDDFGTGYSSLQYLKLLPLDQLKIDQSFVRDIVFDDSDRAIVRTIIAMAQSLNLNVIAEGVETEEQRQLLLNKGCTSYQGYLFGRPVPIEQFEALLKQS